jgi:hypothetical protein
LHGLYEAGGLAALETLLKTGNKLVVAADVVDEIDVYDGNRSVRDWVRQGTHTEPLGGHPCG